MMASAARKHRYRAHVKRRGCQRRSPATITAASLSLDLRAKVANSSASAARSSASSTTEREDLLCDAVDEALADAGLRAGPHRSAWVAP